VHANPQINSWQIEYEFDISRKSVLRILIMNHKFHHISLNKKLHD